MRFETLSDVLSHQFIGKCRADRPAFAAINEFMSRSTTTAGEAREADRHACEQGMGEPYTEE